MMNFERAMEKAGVKVSIIKPLVFSTLSPIDSFLFEKGTVAISDSTELGCLPIIERGSRGDVNGKDFMLNML